MNKISFLATAFIWCLASVVSAQEEPEVYTLKRCLEIGLENNYSIRLVKIDQQVSDNNATPANAGLLPTLDLTGGYNGDLGTTRTEARDTGMRTKEGAAYDQGVNVNLGLNWTLFDGFNLITNYKQLQLLKQQGELNTRIAVEDFIAALASEYYNFIQQKIRLKNFHYAMMLSMERMRIVEERFHIGNFSRLDYQQAKVDFNADSAQYMKQQEALATSKIKLNELMSNEDVNRWLIIRDTLINVNPDFVYADLWKSTLLTNASLLRADQNTRLSEMALKKVLSRNYPYVKLNAGYGYSYNRYGLTSTRMRDNWGLNAGLTVGINLFDGAKKAERANARLEIENTKLVREQLELSLKADMSNLWQSYQNNLQMLQLERQNLVTARENYEIAHERYMLGDLSGFEMREAQKSLLDAEERLLSAEYNTKMCEISLLQLSGNIMTYLN